MDRMHIFLEILAEARARVDSDPTAAARQAFGVLEDILETLAREYGYSNSKRGIGQYARYLHKKGLLDKGTYGEAQRYSEQRNCLAHSGELQATPGLARNAIEFAERLARRFARTAFDLGAKVRSINETDTLAEAKEIMVSNEYSQLPVVRGGRVIGLFTERDLAYAEAQHELTDANLTESQVKDYLEPDSLKRIRFARRNAPADEVRRILAGDRSIDIVLVTENGKNTERPIKIITRWDLLHSLWTRNLESRSLRGGE